MKERVILFYDEDGKQRRISVNFIESYLEFKKSMMITENKGIFNKIKDHGRKKLQILNKLLENNSNDLLNRNVFQ